MKKRLLLAIAAFTSLEAWPQSPDSPEAAAPVFANANLAYEQARYERAAADYESLARAGFSSAPVLFNLGNAYYQLGQHGKAIHAYRLASLQTPRDPDLVANLALARAQFPAAGRNPIRWWETFFRFNIDEWTWIGTAALWFVFLGLTWNRLARSRLPRLLLVAGTIAAAAGWCGAGLYWWHFSKRACAVIVQSGNVRYGPLAESRTHFIAEEGAEFPVTNRRDGWLEVRDPAGRFGWLEAAAARLISFQNAFPAGDPRAVADPRDRR